MPRYPDSSTGCRSPLFLDKPKHKDQQDRADGGDYQLTDQASGGDTGHAE
jgi:hypothetical protein